MSKNMIAIIDSIVKGERVTIPAMQGKEFKQFVKILRKISKNRRRIIVH